MVFSFKNLRAPMATQTADMSQAGQSYAYAPKAAPPSNMPIGATMKGASVDGIPSVSNPSWMARYAHMAAHGGTMGDADAALRARNLGEIDAAKMRVLRDRVGGAMPEDRQFAMLADTPSFAQAVNENYRPRASQPGQASFSFGMPNPMFIQPDPIAEKNAQTNQDQIQLGREELAARIRDIENNSVIGLQNAGANMLGSRASMMNAETNRRQNGGGYGGIGGPNMFGALMPGDAVPGLPGPYTVAPRGGYPRF